MSVKGYFAFLLRHRRLVLAALVVITAVAAGLTAAKVRPDFAVELLFPQRDHAKVDYDRYKQDFPYEDSRALVVVEAPDIFTEAGLQRIAALERDLANIDGVIDTDGLTTVQDVVGYTSADGDEGLRTERLFPDFDLSEQELAAKRATATTDPLFAWNVCSQDGLATTIRVTMDADYASEDHNRLAFLAEARAVLAKHAYSNQKLTLSGLPVIRAEYTEIISRDMGVLMPLAMAITVVLLFLGLRSLAAVAAAVVTIVVSIVWTLGVSGLLGYPVQLLTQITPIVVMIVSVSDTVHIVTHYRQALASGIGRREALIEASANSFGPCLLTEVVIAVGFLSLWFQDVVLISQFGILTAAGMMLTWLANMTVLQLALWYLQPRQADQASQSTAVMRLLESMLAWIDSVGKRRARLVVGLTVLIVGLALFSATHIGKEYYAFDDLKPESELYQNLRVVEQAHGGSVSLAVYIEPQPASWWLLAASGRGQAMESTLEQVLDQGRGVARPQVSVLTLEAALATPDGQRPDVVLIDGAALGAGGQAALEALLGHGWLSEVPLYLVDAPKDVAAAAEAWGLGVVDTAVALDQALVRSLTRSPEAMHDPAAVAVMDRVATYLEGNVPELQQASSAADYWRKTHKLWVGDQVAKSEPLPTSRQAAAQELEFIDKKLLRDFLSPDHASAAVFGMVPDMGSSRNTDLIDQIKGYLKEQEAESGYKLTLTAIYVIGDSIYRNMVGGLALSLGLALLVSLGVFTAVLRSWRLGLIALVPNVLPLLLTFGIMAALDIDLKPTTVICFSITLVIADDDTIQYLVRYRRRYLKLKALGVEDLHAQAATDTLGESGVPMFLTACTVSAGFFALMVSQFLGLMYLGLLIGISLFTAVFADLFLSPILLRFFKPRI